MNHLKITLLALIILVCASFAVDALVLKQRHWGSATLITGRQVSEQVQPAGLQSPQSTVVQEFAEANAAFNAARQEAEKSITAVKDLLNNVKSVTKSSPELAAAVNADYDTLILRATELGQLLEQTQWVFQWSAQTATDDVNTRIYRVTESILLRSQDLIKDGEALVRKLEQQKAALEKTAAAKNAEKAKLAAERQRLKESVKQKQMASKAEREEKTAKWGKTLETFMSWFRGLF